MISAVTRPDEGAADTSFEGLVLLAGDARELLGALRAAESPYPSVVQVADQVRRRIASGVFAPGASLPLRRVATDLGCRTDSLILAFQDLADDGIVEKLTNGRTRVRPDPNGTAEPGTGPDGRAGTPGIHSNRGRDRLIADWLRALVNAGAFLPGTVLPGRPRLARILVASDRPLRQAIHALVADGTLRFARGARPRVPDNAPWRTPRSRPSSQHPSRRTASTFALPPSGTSPPSWTAGGRPDAHHRAPNSTTTSTICTRPSTTWCTAPTTDPRHGRRRRERRSARPLDALRPWR
ncbi:GntR family transcriptional regulator [Streptomyces sp. M19]